MLQLSAEDGYTPFMKPSSGSALLTIEDYSFTYPSYPGLTAEPLFKGMNFVLNRGDFRVLLGPPESGKTTLTRCLASLYPGFTGAETQGRILIDGERVENRSACDWIDRVGVVLQDPDEQIVSSRCDDEVAFPLESLGVPSENIAERMKQAFRDFSVNWPEERDPLSLSGGEKKRLLLAGLRMQNPDLWILDETVDELDSESRAFLLKELKQIAEEEGKGILLLASKYSPCYEDSGASLAFLSKGGIVIPEDNERKLSLMQELGLVQGEPDIFSGPLTGRAPVDQPLITLEGIKYQYPGNKGFVLQIGHFSVSAGSISLLRGPNGCGKSTLAKILCGILEPHEGSVLLEGIPADKNTLNRSCGYLFQNPDYQLFLPTVEDELSLGLKSAGLSRQEKKELIDHTVELFRLPGKDAPPSLMSFGGRKRLQGAIYYLLNKKIYIMDEADSGLNYSDYAMVAEQLGKKGAALIVISHNTDLRHGAGVSCFHMEEGKILPVSSSQSGGLS